jgi:hypothetical protein
VFAELSNVTGMGFRPNNTGPGSVPGPSVHVKCAIYLLCLLELSFS